MRRAVTRFVELLLKRGRWIYLAVVAGVTAVLGMAALGVTTEQNNESMISLSADDRAIDAELSRVFGDDEDLVVAVTTPRLLDAASLQILDELTRRIEALDGVQRVYSLTNAIELVPSPYGAEARPLFDRPFESIDPQVRKAALARNPELTGFLVSSDGRTAGLLVEVESRPRDRVYRNAIIDGLGTLSSELGIGPTRMHFTGIAAQKSEVTRLLDRDQRVLIPASFVMLAVVLFAFFRRPAGVLLPLAVTGVSLVWTLGIYGLVGLQLNTMTALLPPVLMVLSVATSVHLLVGWLQPRGQATLPAIVSMLQDLSYPCTFTSLTTALGMLSLTLSSTPAVRNFGAFAALGVMISLGVALTLVPVGLSFLRRPPTTPARQTSPLARALEATARVSCGRPIAILSVALALSGLAIIGITRIENNTDLVRFLKSDNRLYRDTLYIDDHLAGTSILELVLSRGDHEPLSSLDAMSRLVAFRAALLRRAGVSGTQSVLSLLSPVYRAEFGGAPGALPETEDALLASFDLLEAAGDEGLVRRLISPDLRKARIRVQLRAVGSARAARLEDAILADAGEIFGAAYQLQAAGSFHQVVRDSNRLVANQVVSFSVALVLVMTAIGLMFRSPRWMALSLIPNVMPVIWTGGLMGWLSVDLSTGTGMIAAVVIGIAVDDTIHYLTRLERERERPIRDAIHVATTGTGRALVIASVVLVVGFWVGALGSFKPTIYFSVFTGITMISALLCDLLVLPASLILLRGTRDA